ncbi:MAG TPA: VOC family protein [Solirubrobacteraceae bacterium]|jgi:predicted enzyme related to lactoylglutathione lyase|nr:VOC family protein [Solirubrobacteraceae bacterium]
MDWKLELIVVPATDVDRSKSFYLDQVGFDLLVDHSAGEDFRVVQLVPSGSDCAIAVMKQPERAGKVLGLHLIVTDIDAARSELQERGVEVTELYHFGDGGQMPGPDPDRRDYNSFFGFEDPDSNGWQVQEVKRNRTDV